MELTAKQLSLLTEAVASQATSVQRRLSPNEREENFKVFERVVRLLVAHFPEAFTVEQLLADPKWLLDPAKAECYYHVKNSSHPRLRELTFSEYAAIAEPATVVAAAKLLLPIALEVLALLPTLPIMELLVDFDGQALDRELEELLGEEDGQS